MCVLCSKYVSLILPMQGKDSIILAQGSEILILHYTIIQ